MSDSRLIAAGFVRRDTMPVKLDRYTSLGSYSLFYMTGENEDCLCASCASALPAETLIYPNVYWEGEPMQCDECSCDIESSYGPVEEST